MKPAKRKRGRPRHGQAPHKQHRHSTTASAPRKQRAPKLGHGPIRNIALAKIRPSPENDQLYRPIDFSDPEIKALAESVRERGILEPLVITDDGYIVSGHRRYAAARLAGLTTVPCRIVPIRRDDDIDRFVVLLREHNRQREKSFDEKLREELVSVNASEAYESLIEHREESVDIDADDVQRVDFDVRRRRATITSAKAPFLAAIKRVLEERREFWPLSDRAIHYALLNDPPLIHASKPGSRYANDLASYKALVELLTRARIAGDIQFRAIADVTRPVTTWECHADVRGFIRQELDGFLKGYWRDLVRSQPCHIEIIGEKNTVDPILRTVAMRYCIPLTTGRGYCSLPPRHALAGRFERSGKEKLVLLFVSDFDPDGEEIAASFARSMRDDFGIENIDARKVALTAEQVQEHELPPVMKAKESSSRCAKFVERYGDDVFELEALPPAVLQDILTAAIDALIDIEAFNGELDRERADAANLEGVRRTVHKQLAGLDLEGDGDE